MFGQMADQVEEGELKKVEALIGSMTPAERSRPEIIDKSRASRIARGSGRRSREVRDLIGRFGQMREMMSGLGEPGGLMSRSSREAKTVVPCWSWQSTQALPSSSCVLPGQ